MIRLGASQVGSYDIGGIEDGGASNGGRYEHEGESFKLQKIVEKYMARDGVRRLENVWSISGCCEVV